MVWFGGDYRNNLSDRLRIYSTGHWSGETTHSSSTWTIILKNISETLTSGKLTSNNLLSAFIIFYNIRRNAFNKISFNLVVAPKFVRPELNLLAIMFLTLFMARATLVLFIQADSNFNLENKTVFWFRSQKADRHFHIFIT